jgi:parvulin-like peptidyl-prolyl isomerase
MAETYSDDPVTARGQGRLAQPIKQWGGPLDPAFRDAAWALDKVGQISEPVKSRFGWHVIKLDEVNEPTRRDIDWKEPRYWDWISDEYLTQKADGWLAGLKDAATIERATTEMIFGLKEQSYWKAPEPPKKEEKQGNDD